MSVLLNALYSTVPDYEARWAHWQSQHGIFFNGVDEQSRFEIFKSNAVFVDTENAKNAGFTLALNQFAHLTHEEFLDEIIGSGTWYQGAIPGRVQFDGHESQSVNMAPDAVDWRSNGILPPVKDQGKCGSCWAFSAIAAIESAHALATSSLVALSEQQLIDCDADCRNCTADPTNPGRKNGGCAGGWPTWAFNYMENASLCTESSYSYTGTDPQSDLNECQSDGCEVGVQKGAVHGYRNVTQTYEGLKSAVAQQPVSVSVMTDVYWQFYHDGVLYPNGCTHETNHAVAVVGYNKSTSSMYDDYFIIRNSWGSSWGIDGHIYVPSRANFQPEDARLYSPACMLWEPPSYPVLSGDVAV